VGPVTFLVIALVVGLLGVAIVTTMHRKPQRPDSAMEEFRREMQALAPQPPADTDRQPTPGASDQSGIGPVADPDEQ
jgi:hypothetical protein